MPPASDVTRTRPRARYGFAPFVGYCRDLRRQRNAGGVNFYPVKATLSTTRWQPGGELRRTVGPVTSPGEWRRAHAVRAAQLAVPGGQWKILRGPGMGNCCVIWAEPAGCDTGYRSSQQPIFSVNGGNSPHRASKPENVGKQSRDDLPTGIRIKTQDAGINDSDTRSRDALVERRASLYPQHQEGRRCHVNKTTRLS
jgi:hypothetical protein